MIDLNDIKEKIHTKVNVQFPGQSVLKDLFVTSIRFSEQNVYYNLLIPIDMDNNEYTTMEDIDSKFVKASVKEPITIE